MPWQDQFFPEFQEGCFLSALEPGAKPAGMGTGRGTGAGC